MGKRSTGLLDGLRAEPPDGYYPVRSTAIRMVRAACQMTQGEMSLRLFGNDGRPLSVTHMVWIESEHAFMDLALAGRIAEALNRLIISRKLEQAGLRKMTWVDLIYAPEEQTRPPRNGDGTAPQEERRELSA